jgi:hypothetical protein
MNLEANRSTVITFCDLMFNQGQPAEAVRRVLRRQLHSALFQRIGHEHQRHTHDAEQGERSITPSITVTIGHHTRVYFAFVTTAPIALDSPATVTLHTAPLGDVAFFAAGPMVFDTTRDPVPARLVLVDAMELAWQRAKYRGHQHPLWPADPGLVGLNTLQHWLWQRLQSSPGNQVAA